MSLKTWMMKKEDERNGVSKEERQRRTNQRNAEWASQHGARTRQSDEQKKLYGLGNEQPQEVSGTHREKRRNAAQQNTNQTASENRMKSQTQKEKGNLTATKRKNSYQVDRESLQDWKSRRDEGRGGSRSEGRGRSRSEGREQPSRDRIKQVFSNSMGRAPRREQMTRDRFSGGSRREQTGGRVSGSAGRESAGRESFNEYRERKRSGMNSKRKSRW